MLNNPKSLWLFHAVISRQKQQIRQKKNRKRKKKRRTRKQGKKTFEESVEVVSDDSTNESHALTDTAVTSAACLNRTLKKGLKIKDLTIGQGECTAQIGSRLQMYYVGTLVASQRRFDTCQSARKPFQFVIGDEDVVEGFEHGCIGMRLGGQRTITVPASLGYGAAGNPGCGIPPDADLKFEVTLVGFF